MKTQYGYTHIIHYKYNDEAEQRIHYYCNDSYSLSDTDIDIIKEELSIEEEDEFEIVGYVGNNFNYDEHLSDELILALNEKPSFENYTELYGAYISNISTNLFGKDKNEYQRLITLSILKYIKAKCINKELVFFILASVGLSLQDKGGIMSQLRLIAIPPSNDTVLKQLAVPSNISTLKHYLNRMDEFFSFKTESSQLKIAAVFYVFMERTELLRSDSSRFETVKRLLSDYYKIPQPTQRLNDVLNYLEKNYPSPKGSKKKSILVFQENEHIKFWNSLR